IKRTEMKAEIQKILSKKDIDMEKEGVYRIRGDHWIGLDVHDLGPPRDVILRPGMVLACDPAIKIRDKAGNVIAGVKIEKTVLITKDGCENLTHLVPRTVEEIEKEMAEKGILDLIKETREKNP
ncbi:MAG: M24 family metallopeptidase, partial [Candidatus Aminicenantes bacterium]|nr:M24 family metallopeptidase [Candidatus Aminicenantes bacterium]